MKNNINNTHIIKQAELNISIGWEIKEKKKFIIISIAIAVIFITLDMFSFKHLYNYENEYVRVLLILIAIFIFIHFHNGNLTSLGLKLIPNHGWIKWLILLGICQCLLSILMISGYFIVTQTDWLPEMRNNYILIAL